MGGGGMMKSGKGGKGGGGSSSSSNNNNNDDDGDAAPLDYEVFDQGVWRAATPAETQRAAQLRAAADGAAAIFLAAQKACGPALQQHLDSRRIVQDALADTERQIAENDELLAMWRERVRANPKFADEYRGTVALFEESAVKLGADLKEAREMVALVERGDHEMRDRFGNVFVDAMAALEFASRARRAFHDAGFREMPLAVAPAAPAHPNRPRTITRSKGGKLPVASRSNNNDDDDDD